jgi:hypothetical protein
VHEVPPGRARIRHRLHGCVRLGKMVSTEPLARAPELAVDHSSSLSASADREMRRGHCMSSR